MQAQRLSARIGAILSLLGGALIIYGVFFLPMVFGNASPCCVNIPFSEWTVANAFSLVGVRLLALPLLALLFVLGTKSKASFFQELSPKIVILRRIAAIAGLIIQAPVGFFMRTGQRYQMTIPQRVDIVAIRDALVRLAETEDKDGFLHPERLLVTMTRAEAESWKRRLMAMDRQQRLADREALLES